MKNYLYSAIATAAVVVTLMATGCKNTTKEEEPKADNRMAHRIEHNEVTVDTLCRKTFMRELVSNGKLEATKRSKLSFEVSGILTRVNAVNGSRVQRGGAIAVVDTMEYALALERAEMTLEKSRLAFLDELVKLGYPLGDTIAPPKDVVRMARIRSGYADAVASRATALRNYNNCTLRAPFAGKVADVELKEYERVSGVFCTLLDDSRLSVRFTVLESEYGFLSVGQEVSVSPYADLRKEIKGKITAINPTIDAHGQVQVDATIVNDGSLTDGMNVKVFVRKAVPDQVVVPKSAVVIRDNLEVLFRYENGKARWTYVHTSLTNSKEYVVEANKERGAELNVGDIIITSGNLNLADGSEVNIIK